LYFCVSHSDGQPPFWKQRRNLVAFLAFLGFFNVYTLRVNLSVGIVAMTSSSDTRVSCSLMGIFRPIVILSTYETIKFPMRPFSVGTQNAGVCESYTVRACVDRRTYKWTHRICLKLFSFILQHFCLHTIALQTCVFIVSNTT